jgi:pimeloyl-ACP methyl ester carboxylesterase
MANDPLQVKPVLDAIAAKNAAFMAYIYDLTIYTNKKPTPETNAVYIAETLKQRCLPDADFALASLNMSSEPNFYRPGTGAISKITCPVLHFWGTLDKTVPEFMVLDNIKALEKQSQYVRFENCGHSPLVDNPDGLAQEILAFIK